MDETVNDVRLCGRVSGEPVKRTLPSGDEVATFRLVVERDRPVGRSRQTVDVIDCAAWSARCRRSVATWSEGDVVEVTGALRRRFFRAGDSTGSRAEVEVRRSRLVRRRQCA